jgi:hypothetical protein
MDRVAEYRTIIRQILNDYFELLRRHPSSGVETQLSLDDDHGQYILLKSGWSGGKRIRATVVHISLRGGKVWIEEDWTEDGIATDLLNAGVPKGDIVLAFQPPEMRQYTEFAVA